MYRYILPYIIFISVLYITSVYAGPKKILIIQSYSKDLKWTSQCEKGIKEVLPKDYLTDVFYMDTKKIPESRFQKKADEAYNYYKKIKPDLVMLGDDNALKFLSPKFSDTRTPVVYFGINNNPRIYYTNKFIPSENITGVLERLPVFPWIRFLKDIVPNLKKALVMADFSPTSKAILEQTFGNRISVLVSGVNVDYKIAETWDQWQRVIKDSKIYDIVILTTFHSVKDLNGNYVDYKKVIEWTSVNTPVPLFGHQDYTVGSLGVAGAMVVQGEEHGKLAGRIVIEILENGKKPKDIYPVWDRYGKFYFNRKQIKRFNLRIPEKISEISVFN